MTLQKLIIEHDWGLYILQERYGNGLYAMIAPSTHHINEIREILTGGDIESLELGFYLGDEGSWLPIVQAKNLEEALKQLENKIFADNNDWKQAVFDAFDCIIEENDGNYGLKIAVEDNKPALLKPIFL